MPHSATDLAPSVRPAAPANPQALFLARCIGLVADDLAAAEARLQTLMHSDITVIPDAAGHLAFAGGKRLRPLLALLCAQAADVTDPERITVAAVGELLHTATLLHDDVIDEGEFRRGRPAARMEYGNGLSVLSGDYCFARSVQAVARTGALPAIESLADTVTRMAEGEVAQLYGAGDITVDRAQYDLVIERKTATLISWCSAVGDLVDPAYRDALRAYGVALGFAFQIADDLLDVALQGTAAQTAAITGKNPGADLREGKMTLPLLLACEADPLLARDVATALEAGPPMEDATAEQILDRIAATGAIEEARDIAQRHADEACRALAPLPPSQAKDALLAIPGFVVRRRH